MATDDDALARDLAALRQVLQDEPPRPQTTKRPTVFFSEVATSPEAANLEGQLHPNCEDYFICSYFICSLGYVWCNHPGYWVRLGDLSEDPLRESYLAQLATILGAERSNGPTWTKLTERLHLQMDHSRFYLANHTGRLFPLRSCEARGWGHLTAAGAVRTREP